MSECINCGETGAECTVPVNNSKQYDGATSKTTEKDVPFEVDFEAHPNDPELDVRTVTLCKQCKRNI